MTIQFELNVTGENVGRALAQNSEEAAYALLSLAEAARPEFHHEVSATLWPHRDKVTAFLRKLADSIAQE